MATSEPNVANSSPRRLLVHFIRLCWFVVSLASVWVMIRWLPTSDVPWVVAVQATSFLAAVAGFPVLAIAAVTHRWFLALASTGVLAVSIVVTASNMGSGQPVDAPRGTALMSITSSNVLVSNPDLRTAADQLMSSGADIVVIQEVDETNLPVIDDAAREYSYAHRAADPQSGFHGGVVYSKYPFDGWRVADVSGSPMLVVDVSTPSGPITVVNVHAVAPLTTDLTAQWRRQFDSLEMMVAASQTPILLVGDFNATVHHRPFATLLELGYHDAFIDVGEGWGNTFPSNFGIVPPFMRIDHVVAPSNIQFHMVDEWDVVGSDHRAITVSFSVRFEGNRR